MSKRVHFTDFYIEELGQDSIMLQTDVTLWRQIKWSQVQVLVPNIRTIFQYLDEFAWILIF